MNTVGLPATPRGNSVEWTLVINVNGSPIDITGYQFAFIASKELNRKIAPPVLINWTQAVPAPDGMTQFVIPSGLTSTLDPGSYFFNITMQDLVGSIKTIMAGTWPISPVPGLMSGAVM